ncbi:hypothetical protein B0H12DRAFT_1148181 [Mycena haematopus]|nr:hypothetical protein B0H12DRAFT_1148181 [Mycena haematopus]
MSSLFAIQSGSVEQYEAFVEEGQVETISIHIQVKIMGQPDTEQVFAGIHFPSSLITERGPPGNKTKTATLLGLLCGLRYHVKQTGVPVNPSIIEILTGELPAANITAATTRAPNFGEGTYRNVHTGFRELGFLADASGLIPAPGFAAALDVPATLGTEAGAHYFVVWSGMDVIPASHFVIIFIVEHTTPSPFIRYSLEDDRLPSPSSFTPSSFMPTDPLMRSMPSSMQSYSASPSQSSGPSRRQSHSPSLYPPPMVQGSSLRGTALELCRTLVPNFDQLKSAAMFARGTRRNDLVTLVRSHIAMENIIVSLGLDPANLKWAKSFRRGDQPEIELSAFDIIHAFGWAEGTFTSKKSLYKSAKVISGRHWNGAAIETDPGRLGIQNVYRGIQFIWAENGPLAPGATSLPSPEVEGAERLAAQLRQADLERHNRVLLDKYTVDPRSSQCS